NGESGKVSARWLGVSCPWCDHPGTYLGIPQNGGRIASCWSCGVHSLTNSLARLSGLPESRIRALAGQLVRGSSWPEKPRQRAGLRKPTGIGPLGPAHRAHLQGRGFDPDVLERLWKVQGIGWDGGRHAWTLYVPIFLDGQEVSFVCRRVNDDDFERRYVAATADEEAVNHRDCLYGVDLCRHSVVVTEGVTNVWRIGPGAVATFGVKWNRIQVCRLARFAVRAIVFDQEPAAQERAVALCRQLESFEGVTELVELSGPDPATSP